MEESGQWLFKSLGNDSNTAPWENLCPNDEGWVSLIQAEAKSVGGWVKEGGKKSICNPFAAEFESYFFILCYLRDHSQLFEYLILLHALKKGRDMEDFWRLTVEHGDILTAYSLFYTWQQ